VRVVAKLTVVAVLIALLAVPTASANPRALQRQAVAAVLMDVASGEVLQSRNMHERQPIASLTKIMTALLAAESGKLDAVVAVPSCAVAAPPLNIWLSPGEKITLRNLVYGLLLRSGNDAAVAIAYFLAGGSEAFAAKMNERAKELGAVNSNFVNPHGLPHEDHFSTAYDVGLITRALLGNTFLRQVVGTARYRVPWEGRRYDRIWHNTNRLLQLMPGADGVKTGWTRAAGRCLAASATRQGWQLLAIVLNSPDRYGETRALLEWGFANYRRIVVVERGLYLGSVRVMRGDPPSIGAVAARDLVWVVPKGCSPDVSTAVLLPPYIRPPVPPGSVIGSLSVKIEKREVARVQLLADQGAVHTSWWSRLRHLAQQYVRFLDYPLRWST
jgi:D-alanyl-D-alanine carboxypeptidase (penicillin-binding protein 5/6)